MNIFLHLMQLSLTLWTPDYDNRCHFCCCIERTTPLFHVISNSRIEMIFGDFNINYLHEIHSQPLSFMKSLNYTQIVTEQHLFLLVAYWITCM